MEVTVGVRELRAHLGRYLKIVREGGTVTITDRGAPIGAIRPTGEIKESLVERFRALAEAGVVAWNGQQLGPYEPVVRVLDGGMVSDLVVENRE